MLLLHIRILSSFTVSSLAQPPHFGMGGKRFVCVCQCVCVYIFFFIFFSIMVYYRILNVVFCAAQ